MLYSIFVYASDTGLLMWEKNYDPSSNQQLEMLGSFFSAIKGFVKEIVLRGAKNDTLKNIEMGTHIIHIVAVKDLGVDIVFIGDTDDEGKIKKVTPKLVEILEGFPQLFTGWEGGDLSRFDPISAPFEEVLGKQKGLLTQTKSLADDQEAVIRAIFVKRGKLVPEEISILQQERDRLKSCIGSTTNFLVKQRLMGELCQVEQRLGDKDNFLVIFKQQGQLAQEIHDIHYKLNYWLQETKNNLSRAVDAISRSQKSVKQGDYKDAFRTFTDFTTTLKKVANDQLVTRFQVMCRYLIEKDYTPPELLSQTIKDILNLENDAFEIIKTSEAPLQAELSM